MDAWGLLKDTFREWKEDDALQWGAALAYYAVFSIAPILLIGMAVAGLVFDADGMQKAVVAELEKLMGARAAQAVETAVAGRDRQEGILAVAVGGVALLVGATTVFAQLKVALNRMWDVRSRVSGVMGFLRKRVFAFAMIAAIGFLLLVSLVASAAMSAFDVWLHRSTLSAVLLAAASLAVEVAVTTLLFAAVFRLLPDVEIRWRDVWLGALGTAVLFTFGKWVIGLYIGNSAAVSSYGAAGALVVLLVWAYFSSQVLLFGAEFTQVYTRRRGGGQPSADAEWL